MSYPECPEHKEPMTEHGCSSCFAQEIIESEREYKTFRLPAYFLMDHCDRSLPTPYVINWIGSQNYRPRYAIVYVGDPSLSELESDASHYAHPNGPDSISVQLKQSAKATVEAIQKALKG